MQKTFLTWDFIKPELSDKPPRFFILCATAMTRIPQKCQPQTDIQINTQINTQTNVLYSALKFSSAENCPTAALVAVLVATGTLALGGQRANAQTVSIDERLTSSGATLNFDADSGQVQLDVNSFNVQTGPLRNTSNIPLPTVLPESVRQGQPLPVDRSRQAPNTIEITPDINYVRETLDDALDPGRDSVTNYTLDEESLELTTQFDLNWRQGSHDFGEGIEAFVIDENGQETSRESAFVRGDVIRRGPNNELLPDSTRLNVNYGANDTVNLRVLNLRREGFAPRESAIYFTNDGQFIVEDLQNGGDLDFDDGEYLEFFGGRGEAEVVEELREVEREEEVTETPLEPRTRQEEVVETDVVRSIEQMDAVTDEVVERGEIEISDAVSNRIPHSSRARAVNDELLIYAQYIAANEVRAGSDGIGITGQLAPLANNPNVPPTLLTGNLTFNPFVSDNEAGLTGTIGLTQFLTPTHRQATDGLGNAIVNPTGSSRRLLEPTGLFNNRRLVGYVPATTDDPILSDAVSSINGIFDLPGDQPVFVAPPDAQQVGRGNAAYTDNVGGLLIERTDGTRTFVPQWTNEGYAQEPLSLAAGEASRLIYALVPQQPGQALRLGETYAISDGADSYQITEGGFTVISADRHPENFAQEMDEVYAVEDTLPDRNNAVTPEFNGIPGMYAEQFGGVRVPTYDVGLATEADARVGNTLYPLQSPIVNPGQIAYSETTVAAGFYLGGSLTGGLGNREDTIRRTEISMDAEIEELRTTRTVNTFEISRFRVDTVVSETVTTTRQAGTARFDINERGELTNARFLEGEVLSVDVNTQELERSRQFRRGDPVLVSSETTEEFELMDSQIISADESTSTRKETTADFAPVQGELALGGILNFGNTPWTPAANTLRAELFARDTVFGRSSNGSEIGWRTEVVFHPFGEVRQEAFQYNAAGTAVPVYQTQALLDAGGKQVMETRTDADGNPVEMTVNEFKRDDGGALMAQMVGTGRPQGPGIYLRVEDAFDDGESVLFAGGLQFSF